MTTSASIHPYVRHAGKGQTSRSTARRGASLLPVSAWPSETAAVLLVGALGAAAIVISPVTPWTTGVAIFGLELFVPAVSVLGAWLVRNRS